MAKTEECPVCKKRVIFWDYCVKCKETVCNVCYRNSKCCKRKVKK